MLLLNSVVSMPHSYLINCPFIIFIVFFCSVQENGTVVSLHCVSFSLTNYEKSDAVYYKVSSWKPVIT